MKTAGAILSLVVVAVSNLTIVDAPLAESYPARPITVVVPYPAGGPTDTLARILTERMQVSLGQSIVVENVSGAMGSVGIGRVARAVPDGYTLSLGDWNSYVLAGAIRPDQYDVLKDLEPVALLTIARLWLVGRIGLPAKNVTELIAWMKPNPVTFATVGAGSAGHLFGIALQDKIEAHFQFVPYKGGAPAYQDLVAGHVDLMCTDMTTTLPLARNGSIKGYAVLSKNRLSTVPEIPTMDEVGLPGLDIAFWRSLWAPKRTPKDIIAKLNSAVIEALADTAVSRRIAEVNQEIPAREQQTPEALIALQKADVEKWWPIIKANIKGE
jgi:tripartite-type tricarboxylate transporter receptor subunit TctC